jgi:hypothetical protein
VLDLAARGPLGWMTRSWEGAEGLDVTTSHAVRTTGGDLARETAEP